MFFDFFSLELKQRFKSISTYVFFLIPFVMMLFTESARDFSPVPNGKVFLNGPWALYRDRPPSVPEIHNHTTNGDAFFADYTVIASISHHF